MSRHKYIVFDVKKGIANCYKMPFYRNGLVVDRGCVGCLTSTVQCISMHQS